MNDKDKMYILNDILCDVKPIYLRQRVGARFVEFVDNKIPEGSVVLSKEEYNGYDKLISQYRNLEINYNAMYENYRKYALENETLKQELVILQTECKQAHKQSMIFKDSKIYLNERHIGNIDFSPYDDIKALGFGNFEIIDKRKGFGTFVINEIVAQNKNKYDLIYCFVHKENVSAIEFYKRVGKVHFDKINDKNQYYVTIYESVDQVRKQAVKEVLGRLKAYIDQNEVQTTYFGNKCFIDKETIDEIAKERGVDL